MLNIIRIFAAATILTAWSQMAPAVSAHIASVGQPGQWVNAASAPEATCPLRAWPYIG